MNPKTKRQAVVPTIPELEALTDKLASDTKNARFRALVLLSAWCGLRYGEVSELRRRDFDPDCTVVTVARGVTHRSRNCMIDMPKDGKPATVVIPPRIPGDVEANIVNYVGRQVYSMLFTPVRAGCHVNVRVFAKEVFKPVMDAIGREDWRVHDLRRFSGTMTARVGNLSETMAQLRRSTMKASVIHQSQVSGRDIAVDDALSALRTETIAASSVGSRAASSVSA